MTAKKRKKISIDLDIHVINTLDRYKQANQGATYTSIINDILDSMFNLNPSIKHALADACKKEYNRIHSKQETPNSMAFGLNYETMKQLEKAYKYLSNDLDTFNHTILDNMCEIEIKDGIVTLPSDWINVKYDSQEEAEYVGVIETYQDFQTEIPHFYFFSKKPINTLTPFEEDELLDRCCEQYPGYEKVLATQRDDIRDDEGNFLIGKAILSVPIPKFFEIPEYGSRESQESNYPYGAKVFRNSGAYKY